MDQRVPQLSIGLPVYNAENYLRVCLDSLLGQTFRDFELIITDNTSTDNTATICKEYAARDTRIRYYRNETNIGSTLNFNRAFALSRGKYFKWAAHDDLHLPRFLEKCVQVLDGDEDIVLCHSKTALIDAKGNITRYHEETMRTHSDRVEVRFHDLLANFMVYEIFGVIRSDALSKTSLIGRFGHGEGVLLAHLGLMGRFHEVPEYLFLNRIHPAKSQNLYKTYREYSVWLDPSKAGKILLPRWRMGFEYFKTIWSAPLLPRYRFLCVLQMGYWVRTFWKSLVSNLLVAARELITLPLRRSRRRSESHQERSWQEYKPEVNGREMPRP